VSLARFLHRRVVLPAFETGIKRRRTLRYWSGLERSQWLDAEQLAADQIASLRDLLRHAYAECEYYRRAWDVRGLRPDGVASLADFEEWPVIDRHTIREHRVSMRAGRCRGPLISKATGGSTGVPLQFDLDQDSHERRTAAWHRGYGWAGAAPGTRQLYLWGAPTGGGRLKDRLYQRLYRRSVVSCFEMDEGFAARFAATIDRERPDALVAYVNPLYETALRLQTLNRIPDWRPRSIVVGAERLHGFQRDAIERVFGAPVHETYGSREFMLIAAECERRQGLHLTSEHLIVEILDDTGRPARAGEEGDVVITDLFNYGMPFVRYANGDRATAGFGRCSCGRGLGLLRGLCGRSLDVLRLRDGRGLPGEFFPHLIKDFPSVHRFQVVQEGPERVRLVMVAPSMPALEHRRLEAAVRGALGPGVQLALDSVASIPLTKAGKHRVVVGLEEPRRAA
jgi:phenylacetate-CoA ligase